jgi:hypothetical protein
VKDSYLAFWTIAYCSLASALIPSIIGIFKFSKRAAFLKTLCLFTCLSFLLDALSALLPRSANDLNNVFRLIEFLLLLSIYYIAFKPSFGKTLFISVSCLYIVFFSIELVRHQKGHLNSYSTSLTSMVFIVLSVMYFYTLMRDLPTAQIQRLPMFWVNTAVLTYFAGSLFLFSMRPYLINVLKDDQTIYWSFHNFLNIGKNLLFAVALWQDLRKPKPI